MEDKAGSTGLQKRVRGAGFERYLFSQKGYFRIATGIDTDVPHISLVPALGIMFSVLLAR
jgi:hypothetical protein